MLHILTHVVLSFFDFHWQETDDDLDTSLDGSQDEYEGNKDAARALMRVKQKLDGYEEGEMRSIHGQVIFNHNCYLGGPKFQGNFWFDLFLI